MSNLFGIAGVQMMGVPWNMDSTLHAMEEKLAVIHQTFPWVNLVCFPEYCPMGAASQTPWNSAYANSLKTPKVFAMLVERFSEMARKYHVWLQPGSFYETEADAVYNCAAVFSPDGKMEAKYRKIFPWKPYETVDEGRELCVFDIPGAGRFGLSICYDGWFPEVMRSLMWLGAEVILHPTLTHTVDRAQERIIEQAHALFNQCYMVNINAALPSAMGGSLIVDPNGRVLVQAGEGEQFLTAIIDFDLVRQVRQLGALGLSQHLKQFRDTDMLFPMYQPGARPGEMLNGLGELSMRKDLNS